MNNNNVLDLRVNYNRRKKFNFKKSLSIIVLIIIISGLVFLGIFYKDRLNVLFQKQNYEKNLNNKTEADILISKVSKLMELPPDETPTVASILDREKVKDYPFFDNAKNGDKLLIYSRAMKVILYRESTNKIIGIAPLYVQNNK